MKTFDKEETSSFLSPSCLPRTLEKKLEPGNRKKREGPKDRDSSCLLHSKVRK
jgi:hypothetical protein